MVLARDATQDAWLRRAAINHLVEMGQVDNLPTQQRPWWNILRFQKWAFSTCLSFQLILRCGPQSGV